MNRSQTCYNKTNSHSTLRTVPACPEQATSGGVTAATMLPHSTLPQQLLPPRKLSQQHQIMAHPKHTQLSLSTHTAATHAAHRGQETQAPHMPASGVIDLERPITTPLFSSRGQHRRGCRHRRCQRVPGRCSAQLCSRGQPGGWTGSAGGSGRWLRPKRTAGQGGDKHKRQNRPGICLD